jgi:predicted nucleotidyltransferase
MRRDLDHLPPVKQRELERVVQIIFEEFGDALGLSKHEWKRKGRIQKVILYGSYARGGWVDEPHTAKGYQSDYDLLIIVNDKRLTDRVEFWLKLEERLNRELAVTKTLRTPVNFIIHTLQEVNDGLAHGRYFFMDVRADGIALTGSRCTRTKIPSFTSQSRRRPRRRLSWRKSISTSGSPAQLR